MKTTDGWSELLWSSCRNTMSCWETLICWDSCGRLLTRTIEFDPRRPGRGSDFALTHQATITGPLAASSGVCTAIGLLHRIGTPWAPCHDPRAVPERFFAAWQGSLSCWRGAAVAISRFLSRSFHYNEMITVIHFTRQRFLTLSCDKPAKSASSSSLLLGTMLLVDGTKVQQGQWTPSFRPRLFSDRWKRRQRKTSADDDEVQNHC